MIPADYSVLPFIIMTARSRRSSRSRTLRVSKTARLNSSPASLKEATKLCKQVAAHAWEQMIRLERWFGCECVHDLEAGFGTKCHANCHGPIQIDDGRWRDLHERIIQCGDTFPIGIFWIPRLGMTCCDSRLQTIRSQRPANCFCSPRQADHL